MEFLENKNNNLQDDKEIIKNSNSLKITTNTLDNFLKILTISFRNFCKFYGIRALLSILKQIYKIKFKFNNFFIKDLLRTCFNSNNLRTGLFLSIMPLIYKILTEIIFKLKNDGTFKEKLIVLLSGFFASFIGILISEKNVTFLNTIILSIMIRAIFSLIVVNISDKENKNKRKIWAFSSFFIISSSFLFMSHFNPGYKPTLSMILKFCDRELNDKDEFIYIAKHLDIFREN